MQPLVRYAPRLFGSIRHSAASRSLKLSTKAAICQQCRTYQQKRLYADKSKPPPTSTITQPLDTASSVLDDDSHEELPSTKEGRRSHINKRLSHIMDHLQGNIFIASQRINDLTGYSGIESLKSKITDLEKRVQQAQEDVRTSRTVYKTTVADRASTQKEVTTLLARKDNWTPIDLERFTSLYRMDHSNEQAVQEAATKLADAEREVEQAASNLSSSILSRYHEEQIWSDKIRRMSTWGTWGLMGVNILLFFLFQFGFEPWRRARLVHGFEEKVLEALEKEKTLQGIRQSQPANSSINSRGTDIEETESELPLDGIVAGGSLQTPTTKLNPTEDMTNPVIDAMVASTEFDQGKPETRSTLNVDASDQGPLLQLKDPKTWTPVLQDLFSQRHVTVRKQDVTLAALEGVATGAAIVTIIATLILRN